MVAAQSEERGDAAFLSELESEIWWEWHWEKRHRRWTWGVNWATWVCRILLLALATFQISSYSAAIPRPWTLLVIAVLATLNLGLPVLAVTFRFQQRQEVHDTHARAFSVIRTEFLAGTLPLREAMEQFKEIRRQPTEQIVRRTA
jgi:hypothetical protein